MEEKWDGKSFPGAGAFVLGQRHDAVTLLGKRLVAHGYGSFYKEGPGPLFTKVDLKATKAFQKAQGWTGSDADGYPGPETWKRLMAAPAASGGGGGGGSVPESGKPAPPKYDDDIEEFLMTANWDRPHTSKPQKLKKVGQWQYLNITDKPNISLAQGPARVPGHVYLDR